MAQRLFSFIFWLAIVCVSLLTGCGTSYDPGGDPILELESLNLGVVTDEETGVSQVVFPSVDFGESFEAVFEVRNVGSGTLEVGQITVDNNAFTVIREGGSSIGANQSMQFRVRFKPVGFGLQRTTLAFLSNDAERPLVSLKLSGESKAAPEIIVPPVSLTLPDGLNTEQIDEDGELGTLFFHEFELNDPAGAITDEVELVLRGEFSNGSAGNTVKTTEGTERERVTFRNGRMSYYLGIRFGVSTYIDFELFLRFPDGRVTETKTFRLSRPEGAN